MNNNWFNTIGKALSNKFGVSFTEETTEAQLVDMVESLEGIEALQAQAETQTGEIETLTNALTEMESNVNTITEKLQAIEERATNNATQLQQLDGTVTAIQTEVEKHRKAPLQTGGVNSKEMLSESEKAFASKIKTFQIEVKND
jgi:chromosome segregation ATPase